MKLNSDLNMKACSKILTTKTTEHSRISVGTMNTLTGVFVRTSGSPSYQKLFRGCSVPVVFRCSGGQCFTICHQ